ncbi:hypothetical protein L2729_05120 [Shewanella gelidimarina]|uniref:hypothetical protein n=1 Tax=Shewanella gelidimarina TaxID=56813 RepID=UPI002010695D|nr:hypothetical protein [Shewanella gelidimarina]MCL1057375.1 hypothetical protein [Shewanella gelidimarina]
MPSSNILLATGLVFTLGLLILAVVDPLFGQCKSIKARVINSNHQTSTIALPNGSVARVPVGNLEEESHVQVGVKQRLFSGTSEYKLTSTPPLLLNEQASDKKKSL